MSNSCRGCSNAVHDAGWIVQSLLSGGGAPEFEEDHPVSYPRHLRTIQEVIERRCKVIEPDT